MNCEFMYRIILTLLVFSNFCLAQQDAFFSLSTIKARPLGMGGAYTSIEDNIVSASYNPASMNLYRSEKGFRITFFLNPIAPATAYYEPIAAQDDNFNADDKTATFFKNAALLLKSVVITSKFLDFGVILNEQIVDEPSLVAQKNVFKNYDIWNNCYHTVLTRIKLADRVSLGASASLFYRQTDDVVEHDFGFSYGIVIKPGKKLNVGMAYHYMPQLMPDVRLPLEKLVDQTINVGFSYYPSNSTTISVDLRNLTEEKGKSVLEPHVGFEQRVFSLFALRAGYFQERFTPHRIVSAGVGLIDSNILFSKESKLNQAHFMINYSLIYRSEAKKIFRWHVISVSVRL